MKSLFLLIACLGLFFINTFADEGADKSKSDKPKPEKTKVEVKDIPKEVLDAAKEKIADFEAKEAFTMPDGEGKVYILRGGEHKNDVKVTVDKDGKVTKADIKEKKKHHGDGDKKEEKKPVEAK
jgi:hypothetical protein